MLIACIVKLHKQKVKARQLLQEAPPPSYSQLYMEGTPIETRIRQPSYSNPPSFAAAVGLERQSSIV